MAWMGREPKAPVPAMGQCRLPQPGDLGHPSLGEDGWSHSASGLIPKHSTSISTVLSHNIPHEHWLCQLLWICSFAILGMGFWKCSDFQAKDTASRAAALGEPNPQGWGVLSAQHSLDQHRGSRQG